MGQSLPKDSLILYKNRPARILQSGDKLDIETDSGKTAKVRPKDVTLLHPGPVKNLLGLTPPPGDVETAWELLAGEITTLAELAELIFDEFTPATAWAVWQLLDDGLYFRGSITEIEARLPEDVAKTQADRQAKAREKQARVDFLARVQAGQFSPEQDSRYLQDVESVAFGAQDKSWVLRELGYTQSRESAHALLLNLSVWDETVNPYPRRLNVTTTLPDTLLPELPQESRRNLTHLPAFAIDDADSTDPDDALSLDGDRLWVHVADVAALVPPNSPADIEARARGASLYLPEGTITMLPSAATPMLALGLDDVSPALSFALAVSPTGEVSLQEVVPSWVRVQRLSYQQAEARLHESPFERLLALSQIYTARRQANHAIDLNLPEVKVRVIDGRVVIKPLPNLRSRNMVRDAMLMTGEAVARFAQAQNIPLLYSTQDTPEEGDFADTLSGHFARRRTLTRSQLSSAPAPHAGLGLEMYAQTTSPLRRYADLVVHQQLRAHISGAPPLDEAEVLARVGAAESVMGSVRQAERLANKHWTLVYLLQNPGWQGEGVLVEHDGRRGRVLIPDLDLETRMTVSQKFQLDDSIPLQLSAINLPELEARFKRRKS